MQGAIEVGWVGLRPVKRAPAAPPVECIQCGRELTRRASMICSGCQKVLDSIARDETSVEVSETAQVTI